MSNLRRWLPALAVVIVLACTVLVLRLTARAAPVGYYVSQRALKMELPPVEEALSDRLVIRRQFSSPEEERLLRIAEALYPTQEEMARGLKENFVRGKLPASEDPDRWWWGGSGGLRHVYAVTVDAVQYYMSVAREGSSARCEYIADITQLSTACLDGHTFRNVYVAELSLFWSTRRPATPDSSLVFVGSEFRAKRSVWLAADGRVLAVYGDGPVGVMVFDP